MRVPKSHGFLADRARGRASAASATGMRPGNQLCRTSETHTCGRSRIVLTRPHGLCVGMPMICTSGYHALRAVQVSCRVARRQHCGRTSRLPASQILEQRALVCSRPRTASPALAGVEQRNELLGRTSCFRMQHRDSEHAHAGTRESFGISAFRRLSSLVGTNPFTRAFSSQRSSVCREVINPLEEALSRIPRSVPELPFPVPRSHSHSPQLQGATSALHAHECRARHRHGISRNTPFDIPRAAERTGAPARHRSTRKCAGERQLLQTRQRHEVAVLHTHACS